MQQQLPIEKCIDTGGTGSEAFVGGVAAGFVGLGSKHVAGINYWENFAADHTLTAIGGGLAFGILATIYKGITDYYVALRENPKFTKKEFFDNHKIDITKFGVSIFAVGAPAFGAYTSAAAGLAAKIGEFPADVVAVAIGWAIFAIGSQVPTLKANWMKLLEIAIVLTGFSVGSTVLAPLIAAKLAGDALADYVLIPAAPAVSGLMTTSVKGAIRLGQFLFCKPKEQSETSSLLADPDKQTEVSAEIIVVQSGTNTNNPISEAINHDNDAQTHDDRRNSCCF